MASLSFPASKSLPIGVHLDGDSVTLAQITMHNGWPSLLATATGELPADPTDLPKAAAILRRLLTDHRFTGRTVVSSLSPADLTIQNVRLPQVPDHELRSLLTWEAQERLAYPVEEAEIRHIVAGIVRDEGVTKQEVILLATRCDAIDRHLALLDEAGLTPAAIDIAGCGLARCLGATVTNEPTGIEPARRTFLSLDAAAATMIVAAGGRIVFLKHLACGGRHLDRTLARATGLSEVEAAAMRRTVVNAPALDADDDLHRTVIDALRHSLESMATDVELCLRHVKVTFRGADSQSVSLTGPDAAPWLAEFLSDRLRLPTVVTHPFEIFGRGGSLPETPGRFSTAVGLSLRGLPVRSSAALSA